MHVIENKDGTTKTVEVNHSGLYFINDECDSKSILQVVGETISIAFKPLGFGDKWQNAVATVLGLVAKEEVVGALGTMAEGGLEAAGDEFFGGSWLKGMSFMIFNLLCAPCFAAIGAIKNEMNSKRWTWATLGYMTGLAYAVSLITYQFGMLFKWGQFGFWTVIAIILFVAFFYFLFKPAKFSLINIFKKLFKGRKAQA
jgi:ferrous iron transport protein B